MAPTLGLFDDCSWSSIGLQVALAVEYRPWLEAPWLLACYTNSDEQPRVQAYHLTEAPHTTLLESAVDQWLNEGEIPALPEPASQLLALRFVAVGDLLSSFEGILPSPTPQTATALRRAFLIEWWRKNGPHFAVGFSCAGYDPRDQAP